MECSNIEEALAIGQQVGDQWIVASAINNMGEIARYTGDVGTAWAHYQESLALFRSVASTPDVARAYHSLALIAVRRAEHQEAARLLERSVALYQQVGVKRGIVECLNAIASLAAATGQTEVARSLAATARAEFSKLGAGIWPADKQDVKRFLEQVAMETTTDDSRILTVPAAVAQGQQFLAEITAG